MFVDLGAVLAFLELVSDLYDLFQRLQDALTEDGAPPVVEMTPEERLDALKKATLFIRRLDVDVACFPTGYTTAFIVDMEGNPVP